MFKACTVVGQPACLLVVTQKVRRSLEQVQDVLTSSLLSLVAFDRSVTRDNADVSSRGM